MVPSVSNGGLANHRHGRPAFGIDRMGPDFLFPVAKLGADPAMAGRPGEGGRTKNLVRTVVAIFLPPVAALLTIGLHSRPSPSASMCSA